MIPEAIIVACIAGVTSIIGNWLIHIKETRKYRIEEEKRKQYIDLMLESIEQKLDEHNNYAKKFEVVEKSIIEIKKDIEYLRKDK